mmetsp:Transcript_16774/g.25207  ORF Transcript_16774/g.25207 Transcript_16774/m.25207 type:complete len:304 (+) Transcript_16774:54-965(+)
MIGLFHPHMMVNRQGTETLDRPTNNYDMAGVPRGHWSSGLFGCLENIVPSCILAFCCTPVLWSQVAIRSQIPALVDLKNYSHISRRTSGYHCLVDLYVLFMVVGLLFLALCVIFWGVPYVGYLFLLLTLFTLAPFYYILGHLRTAFRMKYSIPGYFPEGAEAWDCVLDVVIGIFCHPCSLSQMARHVFQYQRWDPEIGLFLGDPSTLPPLEGDFRRPPEADNAGLAWINDTPLPGREGYGQGWQHRPGGAGSSQRSQHPTFATPSRMEDREEAPPVAQAERVHENHGHGGAVYGADGKVIRSH